LNVSLLIVVLVVTGNQGLLQTSADYIFGSFVGNPQLRFYLFDALLIGMSFVVSTWAIGGVHRHGVHVGEVNAEV
jgi:hypothetical protein